MKMDSIRFQGNERITLRQTVTDMADTFTYEFWVKAYADIVLDLEMNQGVSGTTGKRYMIAPVFIAGDDAGVGIAIGRNGISVHEHSVNHLPSVLVHPHDFSEWTHVAVVYNQKRPSLYINGLFVKYGCMSSRRHVYPNVDLGGHEYGNFQGEMKEFRLWKMVRTEQDIAQMMWQDACGTEPNLQWLWNPSSGKLTWNGAPCNLHVSIIMASNRRFPLNLFTLKSLERQMYPHSQMEVILIADGPPDNSFDYPHIINPSFPFKYVQCSSSAGRAAARNLGIHTAMGDVLLFIDAEMICPSHFVQGHVVHHLVRPKQVVSAAMEMKRVFTYLAQGLNSEQVANMYSIFSEEPNVIETLDRYYTQSESQTQLLPEEWILDENYLSKHSYSYDYFQEILRVYGNDFRGFHMPWMNFVTNNVSVRRELLETVGGFDESFRGFGWEDWELGYRLYQYGAEFVHDPSLITYHQEHPILAQNAKQSRRNFRLFQQKHQNIDLRMFMLDMIPNRRSFQEINSLIDEHKNLVQRHADDFSNSIQFIYDTLERISESFAEGKDIHELCQPSNLFPKHRERLISELTQLRALGNYPNLVRMLNQFLS